MRTGSPPFSTTTTTPVRRVRADSSNDRDFELDRTAQDAGLASLECEDRPQFGPLVLPEGDCFRATSYSGPTSGASSNLPCNRNPAHGCVFSSVAVTFTTESAATVSSRFHSANPGIEMTMTWLPVLRPISDGVLPTYLQSTLISAPGGVELKLHRTFCETPPCAEAGGGAGAGAGELCADAAICVTGAGAGEFCRGAGTAGTG